MDKKTKVIYVLSNLEKAIAFEWIADYFDFSKIELKFVLLNPGTSALESELIKRNLEVLQINYHGKKHIPIALAQLIFYFLKEKPDVVHTHLFDANIIGLTAAKICGITKIIYSRHHSTYHHEYYPKAVKYDKYCNALATHIIAISENVKRTLIDKEKVDAKKISMIHHGFKLDEFSNIEASRINKLRAKYNLTDHNPVIGISSRYLKLKGLQYAIPAFAKLLHDYPHAKLLLANASGTDNELVQACLAEIPTNTYSEVRFEHDFIALYKCFDCFLHVPINISCEAFGQTYVESLAAGIPSVFTMSGVAPEFIQDKMNAAVVDYENIEAIYLAMIRILTDHVFASKLQVNGIKSVAEKFNLKIMLDKLESLYLS